MSDDFDRAEQGAHLLVAMGLRLVSVLDAVRQHRQAATPRLWNEAA
jgi:hypothetical protein